MYSHEPAAQVIRIGRETAGGHAQARPQVAIGFGSPADDSGITRIDLNDILVRHPQATFLMRVAGDAMREAGIDSGDLVLIDRAITPAHGHVVIAVVADDFVCRRLVKRGSEVRLQATNPATPDIVPRDDHELEVWGVVTNAIKSMPV